MENRYKDELTVDLVDMVFFFLKKWKTLIAMLLICGILGSGYAVMQSREAPKEYAPSAAMLEKMEQAYLTRQQYENAIKTGSENLTVINNGRALVEALEKAFTGDALTYYQVHYLGMEAPKTVNPTGGIVKSGVLGAFLGVVLWGVWYLVIYLTNSTVKTAEEMASSCGITLLGRVAMEKPAKGFNKMIEACQEKTKRPGTTVPYLAAVIDGAQEGQVSICGGEGEKVQGLMKELEAACAKAKATGLISESEEALKLAKQAESEVLVIHTWHTKRNQILRELEMCSVQGVKILGMIVID